MPPFNPRPFTYNADALHCDQTPLSALATEFGTPLYVYSETNLLERLGLFQEAFATVPHTICYALKANSSLALIKLLAAHGTGFDIVSGGELTRVQTAAPAAVSRAVFAGVGKQTWEIDQALQAGILLFNVESAAELDLLASRAEALAIRAPFSLRVNPDVFAETHPYISTGMSAHKFGVDINIAPELYRRAASMPWLEPRGVSVHIGSQIRAVEPFGAALERVATLVRTLRSEGIHLMHLDAGGGLGIEYDTAAFDPQKAVQDYAAQLLPTVRELGLHLLLEPGRFLIAQAGALVTRVINRKTNRDKSFVITDAGMNDLIRPALYQAHHEIWAVRKAAGDEGEVDIVGPVCESGDFFARDRLMTHTEPGDLLAILDAGAYGMSLSSNYNSRPRPAEVLVAGATHRLIRRRETLDDLLAPEMV